MNMIYQWIGFAAFWLAVMFSACMLVFVATSLWLDRARIRWPWQRNAGVTASEPLVTREQALDALEDMDDFARMTAGVDAMGPRETLRQFINERAPAAGVGIPQPDQLKEN